MQLVLEYLAPLRSKTWEIPCEVDSAINLDLNSNNVRSKSANVTNGKAWLLPAWMMSLAHSLHGNKATYILQPFTSAEFLFMMAFSSAWHTVKENEEKG